MMTRPTAVAFGRIQCLLQSGTTRSLSDAQLLERFAGARDESAFEALLERHGPLVLGVCRNVLREERDVEDAFQASFLLLVEKADRIRDRATVAGWLFRVSYRTALRARKSAALRQRHEANSAIPLMATVREPRTDDHGLLHNEIAHLAEKY